MFWCFRWIALSTLWTTGPRSVKICLWIGTFLPSSSVCTTFERKGPLPRLVIPETLILYLLYFWSPLRVSDVDSVYFVALNRSLVCFSAFMSTLYRRIFPFRYPKGIGSHWMWRLVELRFHAFKLSGGASGTIKETQHIWLLYHTY